MISSVSSMNSLSQSSMIQMRQQMFSRIDTNGDGKHDADELAQMVAGNAQGGPGVEDILAKFDTDGDGAVSESEFNAVDAPPPPPMGGAGSMSTADFIKEMFGEIDANSDGTIDADELEQMVAMGPQGGPGVSELLEELDTDGDGSISESEFSQGPFAGGHVQGPPPPPPPAEDESEVESIFSMLDTDGDGSISESELNSALSAYTQSSGSSHSANSYGSGAYGSGSSLYA